MSHLPSSQGCLSDSPDVPTVWLQSLARFSVGGKRFKVSPHQIYEESTYFSERYLVGKPPNAVIVLEDVTASQWSTFLELLSPRLSTFTASIEFTKAQWIDVLTVATVFRFDRFRKMAMYRLGDLLFDPLEAIVLGRQAYFSDWVLKAYDILVRREAPITEEESEVIGHLTTVRLFNIRHNLHWELGHCREETQTKVAADTEAGNAECDEEALESGDDPVPLSEVDDIVRDCLLQKFEEEFALIEGEEISRQYLEYSEGDDDNDEEQEVEANADADDGVETTTGSILLDEEDEEALEEYLNQEDEGECRRNCSPSASTSPPLPWDPTQLNSDATGQESEGDDDDERTRVGSQRSDVGDAWSEDDEDSPANSFSSTSAERSVDDEDEAGGLCINLIGYDTPQLQSGINFLDINFAALTNFRRAGEPGGSAVVDSRSPSNVVRNAGVFRRPTSPPNADDRRVAGESHRRIEALVPQSFAKESHGLRQGAGSPITNPFNPLHLGRTGDDEDYNDADRSDPTLCLVT